MNSCVFPGSFDPVTRGHFDLISRAAGIFDRVTVTVMVNIRKKSSIPAEQRVMLIRKACASLPNVSVDSWDGLLVDYLRQRNEHVVIRGIRNGNECEQEILTLSANRLLYKGIETLFIPCSPGLAGVSSSAVREIAAFGGDISPFVPRGMTEEINSLLSNR